MTDEYFDIHAHWYPENLPAEPETVQEMLRAVGLDLHESFNSDAGYYAVEYTEG